ncbi:hypothetical protein G5C66_07730 [Nocardioides sp. KC13]|uniref:Uncharacterized protein n=1 Tax=Nocardioides turkmenicus TaxID=2711220 RepID=A0A6M1R4Q6_9ACTN|nr:hypothetical protein [Nocardioides sp. KC13]NGN92628.1 hypothetical protein [Nocardioides sp. KC13]
MTETLNQEDSGWTADDIQNAVYAVLDEAFAGEPEIFHRVINRYGVLLRSRSQREALSVLCAEGLAERGKGKGRNGRARPIYRRVAL